MTCIDNNNNNDSDDINMNMMVVNILAQTKYSEQLLCNKCTGGRNSKGPNYKRY